MGAQTLSTAQRRVHNTECGGHGTDIGKRPRLPAWAVQETPKSPLMEVASMLIFANGSSGERAGAPAPDALQADAPQADLVLWDAIGPAPRPRLLPSCPCPCAHTRPRLWDLLQVQRVCTP